MDSIKLEPPSAVGAAPASMEQTAFSPPPSSDASSHFQREQQFLFHLMRMRHFQSTAAAADTADESPPPRLPNRERYLPDIPQSASPDHTHHSLPKRHNSFHHLDQPLDFSAKKMRSEDSGDDCPSPQPTGGGGWFQRHHSFAPSDTAVKAGTAAGDINKHDSLGSDGHSDLSTTCSPLSEESPRQPRTLAA